MRRPSGARSTRPAAAASGVHRSLERGVEATGARARRRGRRSVSPSPLRGPAAPGSVASLGSSSGSPPKKRCRSVAPGVTTWPAPITHWATVARAPTRAPGPTTVGPMTVAPSSTSAPSCRTTGPTTLADGWTRTPGPACSDELRPSRAGARRARSRTMRSFMARKPRSVPRFTAPLSRGRSRLGTPSEARTRRSRGKRAERQLEGHAQAGHRDERGGDARGEGPGDGVVVALDRPDASRGVGVHVLLGALAVLIEGHEVLHAARVVVLAQPGDGRVQGVEGEAGRVREQETIRGLVAVEALDEGGQRLHDLRVGAGPPDRLFVGRVDLEPRDDHGRRAGDDPEAGEAGGSGRCRHRGGRGAGIPRAPGEGTPAGSREGRERSTTSGALVLPV